MVILDETNAIYIGRCFAILADMVLTDLATTNVVYHLNTTRFSLSNIFFCFFLYCFLYDNPFGYKVFKALPQMEYIFWCGYPIHIYVFLVMIKYWLPSKEWNRIVICENRKLAQTNEIFRLHRVWQCISLYRFYLFDICVFGYCFLEIKKFIG